MRKVIFGGIGVNYEICNRKLVVKPFNKEKIVFFYDLIVRVLFIKT